VSGRRRGHGEGSVYRTSDGRWRGAIDLGWQNGRRERKVVSARTRQEVATKLRQIQGLADQGIVTDSRLTVESWLNRWLDTVIAGRVEAARTGDLYRMIVRRHLVPGLGRIPLDRLSAEDVDRFPAMKAQEGFSRSYVVRIRRLLADALRHAERRGLVAQNAAQLSVLPKTQPPKKQASFTVDQARALVHAANGERLGALIVVGLSLGLRPGELGGLLWSDVDLDPTPPPFP
jgi:integrase